MKTDKGGEWLLLAVIILIGAFLRLAPFLIFDFPLNDGGLMYAFTQDLQDNGFRVPLYSSYNGGAIPYAYPPLPFYLAAAINSFFKISLLDILKYLPAVFSILAIPVFYLVAREVLRTKFQALHAAFLFSMAISSVEWEIFGGGLSRSPAYLFLILAMYFAIRGSRGNWRWLIACSAALAFTCGFHLQIFWIAVVFSVVIFLFLAADRRSGIRNLILSGAGTLLLVSPYLYSVLRNHGIAPLFAAFGSGSFTLLSSLNLLLFGTPIDEIGFTLVQILALVGFIYAIWKKRFLLPVLVIASVLLDPRSIPRSSIIPITMLAAIGLEHLAFSFKTNAEAPANSKSMFPNRISFIVTAFILMRILYGGVVFLIADESLQSVDRENQEAMAWVAENTSPDSSFLVLRPSTPWQINREAEWFPALAERRSVLTVQGTEWLPDDRFGQTIMMYEDAAIFTHAWSNLSALERSVTSYGEQFTHFYLSHAPSDSGVLLQLAASSEYALVYENEAVQIYEIVRP
jgi:hypothetical protein